MDAIQNTFQSIAQDLPLVQWVVLLLAIVVPIATAIALAVSGKLSAGIVRVAAGFGFIIPALAGIWLSLLYIFTVTDGTYAFTSRIPVGLEFIGIYFHLGLNGISMPLYLMAGLVGFAAGIYAIQSEMENKRLFLVLLLVMQGGLMGVFSSIDVFFFYFFHEFALIPTFIMIAMWGRRGRKAVSIELTVYLTLGAMVTLGGLLLLYLWSGADAFNFIELREAVGELPEESLLFALLLLGFGILVSLFPFHSWAPRGYATAPAPAAMLHAGVLKKFGLYGLIQIAMPVLPVGFATWAPVLLWLALGNIIIIGLVTIAQRDLKLMLGNASVMHMGYAFLGLYAWSTLGLGGVVLMLVAHGLSISLLFLLADVIERRAGSCDFEDLGGMGQKTPVLMGFFVAATMASIGLPGFANFWGELGIFIAIFDSPTSWAVVPAVAGIIISAIYGLRAVGRIFFGDKSVELEGGDLTLSEKLPALVLLIALLGFGIWPRSISDSISDSVELLLGESAPETITFDSSQFGEPTP